MLLRLSHSIFSINPWTLKKKKKSENTLVTKRNEKEVCQSESVWLLVSIDAKNLASKQHSDDKIKPNDSNIDIKTER